MKISKNKKKVITISMIALTMVSIGLFGFKSPMSLTEDDANHCCCAYKHQITNPYAKVYYDWMSTKDCTKIFSGNCTSKSKENCK